ncbi:MAG: hypothetical protein CL569_10055 [Alphaproteobacteria bacterium]|nr:hypothetical protein [Alphaproteobacteria bacterium]
MRFTVQLIRPVDHIVSGRLVDAGLSRSHHPLDARASGSGIYRLVHPARSTCPQDCGTIPLRNHFRPGFRRRRWARARYSADSPRDPTGRLHGSLVSAGILDGATQPQDRGRHTQTAVSKVSGRAPSFHSQYAPSDLVDRMGSDVGAIELSLVRGIPPLFLNGTIAIFAIFFLVLIEWRLALIVLVLVPAAILTSKRFQQSATDRRQGASGANSEMLTLTQQAATGYLPLLIFRAQPLFVGRFLEQLSSFGRLAAGGHFHAGAAARAMELATGITELVVIGAGSWLVYRGDMTIGVLIAFVTLLMNMSASVSRISSALPIVMRGMDSSGRVDALLDDAASLDDPVDTELLPIPEQGICFEDVGFGYGDTPILGDINFSIPAGSIVALVGPSGSGKSTVLSLMMRLHSPTTGHICIDDTALNMATEESLRNLMTAVPQTPTLFQGSVRDNITIAKPDATDEQIEAATRAAGAPDFITNLPDGYETDVGDGGGRLSGGQRQRIALARAFLRDAPILLFDEPTSALDVESEAVINRSITALRGHRTAVVVTHRVADLADFDQIFVFDKGRVAQLGTHAELVDETGVYRNLWLQVRGIHEEREDAASITPERLRQFEFLKDCRDDTLDAMAGLFLSDRQAENRR